MRHFFKPFLLLQILAFAYFDASAQAPALAGFVFANAIGINGKTDVTGPPVTVAHPTINTVAGSPVIIGGVGKLNDTAVLAGGNNPTGTITFTLFLGAAVLDVGPIEELVHELGLHEAFGDRHRNGKIFGLLGSTLCRRVRADREREPEHDRLPGHSTSSA